jgi:GNAT superfamily N-acetyltransferase
MKKDGGWYSSRYSPENASDILQLLNKTLGEKEPLSPSYLDWQFERGPAGSAVSVVAWEDRTGRAIGQATVLPVGVRLAGKTTNAGLVLPPVVDPDFAQDGIGAHLLQEVVGLAGQEDLAFCYAFADQPSLSAFLEDGFERAITLPLLIKPLNPERLAAKTGGGHGLARAASIARMVWRTPPATRQEGVPGLQIEEIDSFDEPFAVFWHRVHQRLPIMVIRDPAYLNWRFVDPPDRRYAIFMARSEGKIRALIAARVTTLGRFSAGVIVDLLVEASGEGRAAGRLLVDHVDAYLKDLDLDMLVTVALRHTDEFRIFRSRGFWVLPKFLEPHPFHLVVRPQSEGSDIVYGLRNWFLTLGDSQIA